MDNNLAPESINALQRLYGSGFNFRQYFPQNENENENANFQNDIKMQQFLQNMHENQIRAYLNGSGGFNSGLLSGGGRATFEIPMESNATFRPYVGGGGAYGSVLTPDGRTKVKSFSPEIGGHVSYRF